MNMNMHLLGMCCFAAGMLLQVHRHVSIEDVARGCSFYLLLLVIVTIC